MKGSIRGGGLRRRFPTRTPVVRDQLRVLDKTADSDATILLYGETGTGKDHLAELIHLVSARSGGPFVRISCAAIPPELFESELFGYEKGAFTDARARKPGLVETAHRGTLYLDEVSGLPASLQAKLLRLVQERKFTRIGGVAELSVDVRFIASSSRPLDVMVREGQFREDLYYRLDVISVNLPPLRERRKDIPRLAAIFLEEESGKHDRPMDGFTDDAMGLLESYEWPGNVRELRGVIRRAVLIEEGPQISVQSLPSHSLRSERALVSNATSAGWSLERLEEEYIREVLRRTRGNNSRASRILGISRKTLIEKRRRYGIEKNR